MDKNSNKTFMKGAAILLLANLLVKIIGAGFKIPLTYLLDERGMGLFTTSYTIYTLLFIVATAGLPVAVSKMVAESAAKNRRLEIKKILESSFLLLGIIGVLGFVILFFSADNLAGYTGSIEAAPGIRALAPAILFVALMSAFRGFFQGHQDMIPTAISEVTEALGKLVIGYTLAYLLIDKGVEYASAGAVFGVSMGAALGFISLLFLYIKRKDKRDFSSGVSESKRRRELIKKIIVIAIPITIGACVFSLTTVIDMLMIQNRLRFAGFTEERALALWGSYSGYSVTIFNMIPTLITCISISVVPAIAKAYAVRNYEDAQNTTAMGMKTTILFSLPCAVGIALLARPILNIVFKNTNAAPTLQILGYAVVFVSLVLVTNAILQATGKTWVPVWHMAIGGIVKVIINFFLVGNPDININGAPIGTNLCYIIILVLNIISIGKIIGIKLNLSDAIFKPLISVTAMGIVTMVLYQLVDGSGRLFEAVVPIAGGAVIYFAMLFALKAINDEDIKMLPAGERILIKLKNIKLMK